MVRRWACYQYFHNRCIKYMTFRIHKGRHRAWPLRFNFWWCKSSFTWKVRFTESCRYDLGTADQLDTNKLIGIGYLPGHHKNSARFGWRYDTQRKQIEIMAYCYVSGRRIIQSLCFCEIGKEYDLYLKVLSSCYYLGVHNAGCVPALGSTYIDHYHDKNFKYRLGLFFGGNRPAPHDIEVETQNIG